MKRAIAIALAALLAFLCFACGKEEKPLGLRTEPGKPSTTLLTLHADTQPLRVVTQAQGVTVTLQKLEYEPTLQFLRPVADEWEETLTPGKEYTINKELAENVPQYRLLVRQGENMAIHNLCEDTLSKDREKDGRTVFEIKGGPWAPAPIDENSPMIHLCRAAAVAPKEEHYDYWYTISNAITTLRAVDLELPPDDEDVYAYRVPVWLFQAYARALFPDITLPSTTDWNWVGHNAGSGEPYLAYAAYSTWIWAQYKNAKQNRDGTWDVTLTVGTTDDDETMEEVIKLAPNKSYNPDSPFEYHIAGLPPKTTGSGPRPPARLEGAWKAPVRQGHSARLEIGGDGAAELFLVMDADDEIDFEMDIEIYSGAIRDVKEGPDETVMEMEFNLDWYIYESDDGSEITGVPQAYRGAYAFRHEWEGDHEVLYVKARAGADPLFGRDALRMLRVR